KHFRERLLRQSPSNSWWLLRYLLLPRTDAWYASLFRSCGDRVAGDITPAYSILGPAEVAHVARLMPAAMIILILRDPVERAWSHARMDRARVGWPFNHIGRAPNTEVPFELLQKHFDSEFATLRGDYPRMLGIWRSH